MAQVPYTGVPETEAPGGTPSGFQDIRASPNAFGAQVGEGLQALGHGMLQAQQVYNEAAADNATNNAIEQATKILRGDPNKTVIGPDGQPTPDTGYFGLRGADAMHARAGVFQQLDELIAEQRQGLTTTVARNHFDNESRRYRAQWLNEMSSHADNEQRAWSLDTNTKSATLALNEFARTPNDPDALDKATEAVRGAFVRNAQLAGQNPEAASLKADQAVAMAQIHALLPTDSKAAQSVLDSKRELLASSPQYDSLAFEVQRRVEFDANHADTENLRKLREDEAYAKARNDTAADGYISQIIKDPYNVSPRSIADDPNLDWRTKEQIARVLREKLTSSDPDVREDRTYGAQIFSIYNRLHLPEGDPNKITDASQVYPLVGHGLTISGADKIISELKPKGPDAAGDTDMRRNFFKQAHEAITKGESGRSITGSEEVFSRWLPKAWSELDKGIRAGKTMNQLTDPDSKDYIGGSIKSFAQQAQDAANQETDTTTNPASAAPKKAAKPDLSALNLDRFPRGEKGHVAGIAAIKAALAGGRITRDQAAAELQQRGWAVPATHAATVQSVLGAQ